VAKVDSVWLNKSFPQLIPLQSPSETLQLEFQTSPFLKPAIVYKGLQLGSIGDDDGATSGSDDVAGIRIWRG